MNARPSRLPGASSPKSGPAVVLAVFLLACLLPHGRAFAREVLTPEEIAEREVAKRREAAPVLVCEPKSLSVSVRRGETRALRLSIGNAGGSVLSWAVISAPKWIAPDRRAGELGFEKKRSLVLTVDPESLPEGPPGGETTGEVVIEARDESGKDAEGSPVTVRVAVEVPAEVPVEPPEHRPPQPEPVAARLSSPKSARASAAPARPTKPPKSRGWRIGLQAGLLDPLAGTDQDFEPAFFWEVVIRFGALPGLHDDRRRWGFEIGGGWSEFDSADSDESSARLLLGRARALFPVGPGGLFVTGGGRLVSEDAYYPGTDYVDHLRGTIDVGAMYRIGKRLEAGIAYSILLATKNVPGMLEFAVGLTF